ncbi:MAG TPA: hypothetical protein PKA88_32115, partial [Polyangiaceae bacterium]|nr:hypothetical protein [Polyangiaceae bacterium]
MARITATLRSVAVLATLGVFGACSVPDFSGFDQPGDAGVGGGAGAGGGGDGGGGGRARGAGGTQDG